MHYISPELEKCSSNTSHSAGSFLYSSAPHCRSMLSLVIIVTIMLHLEAIITSNPSTSYCSCYQMNTSLPFLLLWWNHRPSFKYLLQGAIHNGIMVSMAEFPHFWFWLWLFCLCCISETNTPNDGHFCKSFPAWLFTILPRGEKLPVYAMKKKNQLGKCSL